MNGYCRVCGTRIAPFMSFGRMPIANGFRRPEETSDEYFFELAPAFCTPCGMFQLMEQPQPEKMFHEQYAFYSSTSRYMQRHFESLAHSAISGVLAGRDDPFAVEHGGADAILAANVMCHIPDLPGVAAGVQRLLKRDGVFIFEDPYLGDMITKTSYDQIYDEHVFIFSATSVRRAFAPFGLELVDVIPQVTHGGSMRYVLAPNGSRQISKKVYEQLGKESTLGLDRPETYLRFKANCENSRTTLMHMLESLRTRGKRVVGYGATSKSTTVINYCGMTPAHVEFISDTTPIKQGRLSPGAHIPVRPYGEFVGRYPDYALLFAWNHSAEIREKESAFVAAGGRWIVYVPEVAIVS